MPKNHVNKLCRYCYDALDRLVSCSSEAQETIRFFYLKDRLVTQIQGAVQSSIIQHEDQLLAQQQGQYGSLKNTFLASDQQRSVLATLHSNCFHPIAYTLYGYHPVVNRSHSLLGFNGERLDPVSGRYLLGNGYRAFNPALMRFNSPDSLSPFEKGGLNPYSRVDPLNFHDPTGHWATSILKSVYDWASKRAYSLMGQHSKAIKNLKPLGKDFYAYEDIYKGGLRITFDAHSGVANGERYIMAGDRKIPATQLPSIASKNNIDLTRYNSIRLLICQSADVINGTSLAQMVANKTGLNVKAFHGKVTADNISNLGYKMRIGETYQPTEKLTIYKKPGPLSFLSTTSSNNYNSVTVKPIR